MSLPDKCCGKCKWLDVQPDKGGRLRVYARNGYRCNVPDPAMPALPACMTEAYGFHWPPSRNWVLATYGANCPTFEARS